MRTVRCGVGVLAAVLCAAGAQAAPLERKDVPADAKWLAHFDVDAMRSSAVMQAFYDECIKGQKSEKLLDKVAQPCGMAPRKDLHGLTLYGTQIAEGHGVMIVRAEMDRDALLEKAKQAPDHRVKEYRDHDLHCWTRKKHGRDMTAAGAFYKPGVLVLASGPETLKAALGVLDGRSDDLQGGDSPLATEIPKGAMFFARAAGIRQSQVGDKFPLCSQLDRLEYAEGKRRDKWFARLTVGCKNEDVARRVETGLDGLKAMFWLHAADTPELRQLLDKVETGRKELFDEAETGRKGKVVQMDFQSPVDKVAEAMGPTCELIAKHCRKCMAKYGMMADYKGEAGKDKGKPEKPEKKGRKRARPELSPKSDKLKKPEKMRKPTAQQGTPVLGVVIGKPPEAEAAEVLRVWPDSPAQKAGLQPGDRIVKLDDDSIDSPEALRAAVLERKPGDRVQLTVRRDDREKQIEVRLAGGDEFAGWSRRGRLHRLLSPRPWLGIRIGSGAGRGVSVASVLPGSPAERAGLKEGDSILRVDKTRVEAPADLQAAIAGYRPGETVRLAIERDDARKKIEVELGAYGVWEGERAEDARRLLERLLEGRFPLLEDLEGEMQPGPADEAPSEETE